VNFHEKTFDSRPIAPTYCRKKPFGENVEGLSSLKTMLSQRIGLVQHSGIGMIATCRFAATS